ncbi:hypothetical protein [Wolbachia endosymbiont (group A) of Barypeithes pellucidus]|uniref:hypothetical protein n=1 Tax=Wolbachia endosymbiont (group A) of Barypeithes pellucidus TaxID=3139322 RepID=UPI003CCAC007
MKHVEEDTQQVQPTIVNLPVLNPLISVLNTIREAKAPSESGSDHSNSWVSIENGHEQTEPEQAEKEQTKHTNPPLSKEEGSGGFDSGIGSRATSPLYSEQKTEESPVPPSSCVGSPSTAQVNNVNPVNNEVQDPSTLPLKDRITKFGGEALQYQKQFVVQRSQVL